MRGTEGGPLGRREDPGHGGGTPSVQPAPALPLRAARPGRSGEGGEPQRHERPPGGAERRTRTRFPPSLSTRGGRGSTQQERCHKDTCVPKQIKIN